MRYGGNILHLVDKREIKIVVAEKKKMERKDGWQRNKKNFGSGLMEDLGV